MKLLLGGILFTAAIFGLFALVEFILTIVDPFLITIGAFVAIAGFAGWFVSEATK